MCELASIVERSSEAIAELPDVRAEEEFTEIRRAIEVMEAACLRRLPDLERRRVHERDGHLSVASWMASTHRVSYGAARRSAATARALEHMPETQRVLEAGEISPAGVGMLVQARTTDPDAFERSEGVLVQAACLHSISGLSRVVGHWRQAVAAAAGADTEAELRARRRLHASATFAGMVRVDGDLDPETGEVLLTALGAVVDAEVRSGEQDERSPAQRRADALGEVCRQWLDLAPRPAVAGERPHLTLTVSAEALAGSPGTGGGATGGEIPGRGGLGSGHAGGGRTPEASAGRALPAGAELDHTGPVSLRTARRLSCDASVMRVVMAGGSAPLDVGRRTPVVPSSIRRAVVCRDRHCRFPGCDRPHAWCDAHHVVHWAKGGRTGLSNLVLLCRRHHRLVHTGGGFSLELSGGGPVFRRPDGSVLEDRAPPSS
jgi:hypothetical protein